MLARGPVKTTNLFATLARPPVVTVPHRGSSNASTTSSTASTDTIATTPTSNGDKKKRKKKKKSSGAVTTAGGNQESPSNRGHTDGSDASAKKRTSIFAVRSGEGDNQETTDPSQLSLSKRLEIAAAHSDINAALVGLLGWSRLYANTDTILEFFQSRALELLLENIFQACPTADAIFDKLTELLANCVSVERDGKPSATSQSVAHAVVATARIVVSSSTRERPHDAAKAAQYLSQIVVRYRQSLTGGGSSDSTLSQEMLRIDKALAAAAARDSTVQGQSIRETFQRRDIRCDALALYEARLATINRLLLDNISSSTQHLRTDASSSLASSPSHNQQTQPNGAASASTGGFAAFVAADEEQQDAPLDPSELEAIRQQQQTLRERKAAAIAPLEAERQASDTALCALTAQREALEAQLRVLNREIDDAVAAQLTLDEQIAAVDARFVAESQQFDNEHEHVLEQCEREQRRMHMAAAFATLEDAITTISLEHSAVASLQDQRVVCLRQHLEGVLRYFASELPCVQFMRARVAQSEAQRKTLTDEADEYRALGVSAVAKELLAKVSGLASHIAEDRKCLDTLQTRDMALLDTIKTLLEDPEHVDALAALDPTLLKEVQRHVDYVEKLYESAVQEQPSAASST